MNELSDALNLGRAQPDEPFDDTPQGWTDMGFDVETAEGIEWPST